MLLCCSLSLQNSGLTTMTMITFWQLCTQIGWHPSSYTQSCLEFLDIQRTVSMHVWMRQRHHMLAFKHKQLTRTTLREILCNTLLCCSEGHAPVWLFVHAWVCVNADDKVSGSWTLCQHTETPTAPGPGCMVLANDWPKTLKNHCERRNIDTVGKERMGIAICSTTSWSSWSSWHQ